MRLPEVHARQVRDHHPHPASAAADPGRHPPPHRLAHSGASADSPTAGADRPAAGAAANIGTPVANAGSFVLTVTASNDAAPAR